MKTDIKVVIIDDETHGVESVKSFIATNYPSFNILGTANSVKTAVDLLSKVEPDLVFLDIELPDGSGFDILEKLERRSFNIIFVTAYNQYAINAFRYSATDYLLKPFDYDDMERAIKKVLNQKTSGTEHEKQLDTLLQNTKLDRPEKVVLATADSIEFVTVKDIIHIQSDGNYSTLHIKGREDLMVSKNLGEFESILDYLPFFRTHQSHIVNLNYVQKVSRFDGDVLMDGGSIAILSRRKRSQFLEAMTSNIQAKA
jgi:two-component system LytT family response regulator